MNEKTHPKSVALAYLDAVGRKDFAAADALLAPDVSFRGPMGSLSGRAEVSAAYRRVSSFLLRNEPKKVFVDGEEVCLIYDFVTDTQTGAVPTMEWLRVREGKVSSIFLLTDHVRWPKALEEGRQRESRRADA